MDSETPDADMATIMADFMQSKGNMADINESWSQGRAIFGGLVAALVAGGMEKLAGDKPLQSLMTNFVAPLPIGHSTVEASVLRSGRSVTQVVADITAEGQVAAHASAAFGLPRATYNVEIPCLADLPEKKDKLGAENGRRRMPKFLLHFDIYWTGQGLPASGSKDTSLGMWVRHKADMTKFPVAKLIAIADMPPPIMISHYDRPVMGSSLSWSLEFLCDPATVTSDWFYLDFTLESGVGGYTRQSGRIYDEDGRLIMLTRQCMVYFE